MAENSLGDHITSGSVAFRKVGFSMVAAGFSTFALMNCVQPLMPLFSEEFGISASEASLSLSLCIGALAIVMLFTSSISEAVGRKSVMTVSLVVSSLFMIMSAFASTWHGFLAYRALQGAIFSGVPAVAMAYMGEEIDPKQSGYAIGLYVSGAAIGGMSGRVIAGFLADIAGWRQAMLGIGILGLVSAVAFICLLPPSRHFVRQSIRPRALLAQYACHLQDPVQRLLYLQGFLLMGSLVSVYNYLGYRLLAPPFSLSHSVVGLLFTVYLVGICSSVVAGNLADRYGRPILLLLNVVITFLGLLLTLIDAIGATIAGLVVFTTGFFGAHSVASGWVGRRAEAAKAQASSLYLFCYYTGGAVLGWLGGIFWGRLGWPGLSAMIGVVLIVSFLIAIRLSILQTERRRR